MKAGAVVHKHPAARRILRIPDRGTVAQRRDRQPEQLTELDDLIDGSFGHPRADLFPDEVAVGPPADLKTKLFDLLELRTLDHRSEVEPLLTGDHRHPDVAVLGRFDRRHLQRAADRGDLQQLRMQPFAALHRGDRFEHGQIQMFARAAALDAAAHGERAERREHAAHELT